MIRLSDLAVNVQAAAVGALLDNGILTFYGGARPASVSEHPGSPPLAILHFASPAFGEPDGGVIQSLPLVPDTNTTGGAEATWFRASLADGEPAFDGTVAVAGADINLTATALIPPGGELHIASITYRVPKE